MEPVVLHTDRLVLRAPTADDIDAIFKACQDPEIPRWTTVPSPYTRDDAEGFVRLVAEWWADGSQTVWAVIHDDVLVGMVGLHHISDGSAELGYWAVAEYRGRGFITEAALAVVKWGFTELSLVRISWRAVAGNVGSARIARAVGIRYEGTSRQALTSHRGRDDGWIGGVLASDDRTPMEWPIPLD